MYLDPEESVFSSHSANTTPSGICQNRISGQGMKQPEIGEQGESRTEGQVEPRTEGQVESRKERCRVGRRPIKVQGGARTEVISNLIL